MPHSHTFVDEDGQQKNFQIERYPTKCPICGQIGQPNFIIAVGSSRLEKQPIYVALRCPIAECRGLYIAQYHTRTFSGNMHYTALNMVKAFQFLHTLNFPPNIQQVSPTACEIYQQATSAEANGLHQVIGPAYRKSLEFLIKDFLITYKFNSDPDKQDQVRHKFLGNVISEFVEEEVIRNCAKRATWLGNDETHYTRKWEDKDIHDLKGLIKITMNFIDMSIEAARYMAEMPDPSTTSAS